MSISALATGVSGLQAYGNAVNITANNIANASSAGYQAAQAQFHSGAGGGVQASAAAGGGGTDLVKESLNLMLYRNGFEASAKVVKTADDMLGTLLDMHS